MKKWLSDPDVKIKSGYTLSNTDWTNFAIHKKVNGVKVPSNDVIINGVGNVRIKRGTLTSSEYTVSAQLPSTH